MKNSTHSNKLQQAIISNSIDTAQRGQLHHLLGSPEISGIINAKMPSMRKHQYTPTTTLSMFIHQVLSADSSCQEAVNHLNIDRVKQGQAPYSSNTASYVEARKRLSKDLICDLVKESAKRLNEYIPAKWLWKGRHVKLVDGTTILLPDTPDNQSHYPQHGQQEEGVGFPIVRWVGILSLATGAVLNVATAAFQGKGTGETSLIRSMLDSFDEGDIMLGDAIYSSFFIVAEQIKKGVDVILEQHGSRNTDLETGEQIGARDHIAIWKKPKKPGWMTQENYDQYPEQIKVREVKIRSKILITTILLKKEISKKEIGKLFEQRWNVELDLRNIKTTLGMEMLSCKTVEMCHKELWVYMLGYNLIRIFMAESARQSDLLPRQLSFKHTVQLWLAWIGNFLQVFSIHEHMEELFSLIAQIKVGTRPGRVEPRSVKRRPKPYPRLKKPRKVERASVIKNGHAKKLTY